MGFRGIQAGSAGAIGVARYDTHEQAVEAERQFQRELENDACLHPMDIKLPALDNAIKDIGACHLRDKALEAKLDAVMARHNAESIASLKRARAHIDEEIAILEGK